MSCRFEHMASTSFKLKKALCANKGSRFFFFYSQFKQKHTTYPLSWVRHEFPQLFKEKFSVLGNFWFLFGWFVAFCIFFQIGHFWGHLILWYVIPVIKNHCFISSELKVLLCTTRTPASWSKGGARETLLARTLRAPLCKQRSFHFSFSLWASLAEGTGFPLLTMLREIIFGLVPRVEGGTETLGKRLAGSSCSRVHGFMWIVE